MLNQKIQNPNPDELMIEVDLCYELDPYELKLDEMIEAEPEPEMIEGLPASDALTPADRYLELFEHVQSAKIFPDSKTFPDCAPKMDPLDILIRYRKVRRHRDFDLRKLLKPLLATGGLLQRVCIGPAKFPERAYRPAVAGANPRTTGSHSVVFSAGAAAVIYCPGRPF